MFVRKKKKASGVVSIQVIDKTHGKYRVDELYVQGKQWLAEHLGNRDLFVEAAKEQD